MPQTQVADPILNVAKAAVEWACLDLLRDSTSYGDELRSIERRLDAAAERLHMAVDAARDLIKAEIAKSA